MKKWITDHPYFVTSSIFLLLIIIGWQVLYWRAEDFTFLLLLYFIVTLGIRLDDISRKIGGAGKSSAGSMEPESVISHLNDIKAALRKINSTLTKILDEKNEGPK